MSTISQPLRVLMNLAKAQALVSKRFDRLSLHGIGFSDFTILYLLEGSPGTKMRRTDLAESIGLTASGVTRMLLPLEKRGLVRREMNERDARVSYVMLTEPGKRLFEDAKKTALALAKELIPTENLKYADHVLAFFAVLGGNIQ